jgi:hypothetical protein
MNSSFLAEALHPRRRRAVALLGSVPLVAVAGFQVALARGAPYGDTVMGGRATTVDGVLTAPYRRAAVGQAAVLLGMAWVVLGRGGLVDVPGLSSSGLRRAVWGVAGFMTLNTVANVTSPHPVERRMGAATLVVALASAALAARPTGREED